MAQTISNNLGSGISFSPTGTLSIGGKPSNSTIPTRKGIGSMLGFNQPANTGVVPAGSTTTAPVNQGTGTPINAGNATTNPVPPPPVYTPGTSAGSSQTSGTQPVKTTDSTNTNSNNNNSNNTQDNSDNNQNTNSANPYAGYLGQYQTAANTANTLSTDLLAGQNAVMNKPIALPFQQGQNAALVRDYTPLLNQAVNQEQIAATSAGLAAPTSQFGVLTSPVTGQPISPGQTAGSAAFNGGVQQGQNSAGQNYAQANIANTAAKGIQSTIQQYIQQNPDLNASASTVANSAQQWLQGKQLGDPRYQTLFNYLNEYISTLAPILGVGGDTTNLKTEIAQSFINSKASGQSISDVLNSIGTLADQKLQNIQSAGQGGGVVAGNTASNGTPNPGFGWNGQ